MTGFTTPSKSSGSSQIKPPTLIAVSGGSGSGKTYFARALASRLGSANCEIILQDDFYHDQSAKFDFDGGSVNFDHPDAFDFESLEEVLTQLKLGQRALMPQYDFKTHSRIRGGHWVEPKSVLIVDGILVLHHPKVRTLFNESIFFRTPEELRYQRRLERDVRERGRTPEGVYAQFMNQVKPMHDQYVEPCAAFATRIINNSEDYDQVLEEMTKSYAAFSSL